MKRSQRILSLILTVVMTASLLAMGASAASPAFRLYYEFDKTKYAVGDTVTARLYVQRTDSSDDYLLYNFTDYVLFNTDFLSYTGGQANAESFRLESGTNNSGMDYSAPLKYLSLRYQFTAVSGKPALRSAKLLVATLNFKVTADCQTELRHASTAVWTSQDGNAGESASAEPGTITAGNPDYYSVTFSGGTGAAGTVASMSKVASGSYIRLPANGYTNSGKTFKGWFDGTAIRDAGASYYVTKDTSFTAAWSPAKVTYTGGSGGDVTCVNSSNVKVFSGSTVDVGTKLTFSAAANKNYKFSAWGDGSTENPHTITVIGDVNFASPFVSTLSSGKTEPAVVVVDGKDYNIGTSKVDNNTTTVTVDQAALEKQLDTATTSVVVPVSADTSSSAAQLVVENIETMADKNMTLSVQSGNVSYEMPTKAVDTKAVMTELGAADSSKVPVTVTITQLESSAVQVKEGELMVPPVSFTVSASYNGKTYEVDTFTNYVSRVVAIPSGVDASKITTAVVVENGTERHVPTYVYLSGGKWYARINSLTDSVYALIYNTASFKDAAGKWYEKYVTEMASREIISGVGGGNFQGGRSITRAEFAAIIVKALGLPANGSAAKFTDVSAKSWYYGAVGKASEYGIVSGRGADKFAPGANITREEAMVMVQKAAKVAGLTGASAVSLTSYKDAGSVSAWANSAVQFNVANGLIVGSNGSLNPTSPITRAETATVILRLLQKSQLIDVRS
jgi:hypothetical protein